MSTRSKAGGFETRPYGFFPGMLVPFNRFLISDF